MTPQEMNAVVAEELQHYPRGPGGEAENVFRAVYQNLRMNSLGGRPAVPNSAEAVRHAAIRLIREMGVRPAYDPA
jgi:hypothetical protein